MTRKKLAGLSITLFGLLGLGAIWLLTQLHPSVTPGDLLGIGTPIEERIEIGPLCNPGGPSPFIPLHNETASNLVLTGWQLADGTGAYTFPAFTLGPDETVWVWSGAEQDYAGQPPPAQASFGRTQGDIAVTDLYAGRATDHWSTGGEITLREPGLLGRSRSLPATLLAANCDPAP